MARSTLMPRTPTDDHDTDDTIAKVREHREDLQDLADSDLPAARWAAELLALLDDADGESGPT